MPNAIELHERGLQAEHAGCRGDAEQHYRAAIARDPQMAAAHFRLGNLLCDAGEASAAMACFVAARELRPDVAGVHNNLGTLYKDRGDFEEAEACFREAVARDSEFAHAHNNLGTVLQFRGEFDFAAECYRQAISLAPRFVGAHLNLGNLLADLGDVSGATCCFETALKIEPESREARFNRSLTWIRAGRLRDGWREYDSRFGHKVQRRAFPQREWRGPAEDAATLLVYAEQGIGDEIMFASCVPDVVREVGHCFVECDPRLARLFARSFPEANVVPRPIDNLLARSAVLPQMDAQIALGTLPMWYRANFDAFPKRRGYLLPEANAVAKWSRRYAELGSGLKVGISWRGGTELHVRRQRSSRLEQWRPLLDFAGARFVNLQYGDTQSELEMVQSQTGVVVHDWADSDPLEDLDDFAAKIAALDLVISIDNSTVHLAGALGVDVWTLLPFSADFRWFAGRDDSPWYPSMWLSRQTKPGEWDPVIAGVADELRARCADSVPSPHFTVHRTAVRTHAP